MANCLFIKYCDFTFRKIIINTVLLRWFINMVNILIIKKIVIEIVIIDEVDPCILLLEHRYYLFFFLKNGIKFEKPFRKWLI